MSGIRQKFDVHIVGRAYADAKTEYFNEKPIVKFSLMVSSGKNRKTGEWQKPFFVNVKCFGNSAKDVKKGQDVELFGYMTRSEYKGKDGSAKTWDEVVVKTDEKQMPQINFPGMDYTPSRDVRDEHIAAGKAPVIQTRQKVSLEIEDADIPW